MNTKNKKRASLVYQVMVMLMAMLCPGRSKHRDKMRNNGRPLHNVLYSYGTYKTYLGACCRYVRWAHSTYGIRWVADGKPYVGAYLCHRMDRGLSPWTLWTDASALAKLYQMHTPDFGVVLLPRLRSAVKRYAIMSCDIVAFTAMYRDLVDFCLATGLRRHEVILCRIEHIDFLTMTVWTKGKNGKVRRAPIMPGYEDRVREIVDKAVAEGRSKIFEHIPDDAPIHYLRHQYACNLYNYYARPIDDIDREECYYCRSDMSGVVLDRAAMGKVSEALGHHRLGVVTTYLHSHLSK